MRQCAPEVKLPTVEIPHARLSGRHPGDFFEQDVMIPVQLSTPQERAATALPPK